MEQNFPPTPEWRPDLPVDTDAVCEKAKYYTGSRLQLAVFRNGTVAFFPDRVENVEESAMSALDRIFHAHPDFNPLTMDDGNYLIEYSQPAFTIVFRDEIERHWDYIDENHRDGICPSEVLIDAQGRYNVFDDVGKICLFGRAKMFMDALSPEIVRTFEPAGE